MEEPFARQPRDTRAARRARVFASTGMSALVLFGGGNATGVRVNHQLLTGEDVNIYVPSPDGTLLYYVITQPGFDGGQFFRAPVDGSQAALALTLPLPAGRDVLGFQVDPSGQRVVYHADVEAAGRYELFQIPADGSQAPVKLNGPLVAGGDVYPVFRFTPDGSRVVFLADAVLDNHYRLFSAPTDGSQPAVALGTETVQGLFELSPDGSSVAFASFSHVYTVPTDGSAPPLQLSQGAWLSLKVAQFSPDGTRLLYRTVGFPAEDTHEDWIFSVPSDGSASPALLFDPLAHPIYSLVEPTLRVSADSQWVVYRTLPAPSTRILAAPLDGSSAPVQLSHAGGAAGDFRLTANGTVVFRCQPSGQDTGIFTVPVDGSAGPLRIAGAPGEALPVKFEVTSAGRVVFVGFTGSYELFSVPLDGSAAPVRLNPDLAPGGNLAFGSTLNAPSFRISHDEQWVLYRADQLVDERDEAFTVAVDGSRQARRVNGALAPGGEVSSFSFVPGSLRVLYGADQAVDGQHEVFSTQVRSGPNTRNAPATPTRP